MRDDDGLGQGKKPWREVAVSEYVLQVKLTGIADGLGAAGEKERGTKDNP